MKELNAQNNKVSGENRYDDSECRSENKIFATFRLGLLSMAFVCVADVPDNEIFTQRKAIKINKCSCTVGFLVTNLPEIDFLSSYSPPPLTVRAAEQYSNEFAKGPKSKEAAVWRQECSLLLRFGICALALSFSLPPPSPSFSVPRSSGRELRAGGRWEEGKRENEFIHPRRASVCTGGAEGGGEGYRQTGIKGNYAGKFIRASERERLLLLEAPLPWPADREMERRWFLGSKEARAAPLSVRFAKSLRAPRAR